MRDKKPVSAPVRRLFAFSLVRENADRPFLRALIPPGYADSGAAFAPSIASLLPALDRWETLARRAGFSAAADDEDRDLAALKDLYTSFLDRHGFFEPSWEKPQFRAGDHRYVVFFPETLEDYSEYREYLDNPAVTLIHDWVPGASPCMSLVRFDSARTEIRTAALEIKRLHREQKIPYEDMAVTVPDFETTAPYLTRELSLYDIPWTLRAGKALGSSGPGQLFSLAGGCVNAGFSFDTLKSLLLNPYIPWRQIGLNRDLVEFGIKHHCVSSFTERGKPVDPWEEAFERLPDTEKKLREYYGSLKKLLSNLVLAKGFAQIRDRYFAFRELLDMEQCSPEGDAVLGRCIEELSALVRLEEELPGFSVPQPFSFYLSHLEDKRYVKKESRGVNIYDFPVAAGAPFACHFLLNASHRAVTVQYRPLPFLSQEKRAALYLEDRDASAAVLRLYAVPGWEGFSSVSRISAADKTFSGSAIPHSFFSFPGTEPAASSTAAITAAAGIAPAGEDPLLAEQQWWAGRGSFPVELLPIQHRGFRYWKAMTGRPNEENNEENAAAVALVNAALGEKLSAVKGTEALSVSATDLNTFFECPLQWLYKRLFGLEKWKSDAALLDDTSLGIIYHKILEKLFTRIKKEDGIFKRAHLSDYFSWTEEITGTVLRQDPQFRDWPLLEPMGTALARRLRILLRTEAELFSNCRVVELEKSLKSPLDNIVLKGMLDRVSARDGESGYFIVDYKTKTVPTQKAALADAEGVLKDFQIAMYVRLFEQVHGLKASGGHFFCITENKLITVFDDIVGKKSREDFQPTLDALDGYVVRFSENLRDLYFSNRDTSLTACRTCDYRPVCRTCYSLNTNAAAVDDEGELWGNEND